MMGRLAPFTHRAFSQTKHGHGDIRVQIGVGTNNADLSVPLVPMKVFCFFTITFNGFLFFYFMRGTHWDTFRLEFLRADDLQGQLPETDYDTSVKCNNF